ncbi:MULTISPECIES: alpha/beta hydrolase [Mycobacterium]|uniref:alpha/beta hydrolase n=1 Tax=Mycobacterium TaxID=1763 RepID=UPI001EF13C4D|nr:MULTISPECIES: alpha/beta hydrolase [Mycobacterium]
MNAIATAAYGAWHGGGVDLAGMREGFDRMLPGPAPDAVVKDVVVGGVPGRQVEVGEPGPATLLYLHGGGFMLGSSAGYADLGARIARTARARVLLLDYSLAPERPFPAAYDDVLAAYHALLNHGADPDHLVLAGDSAGGGLALAALVGLRDAGDPLPACAVLLSPFADLTLSGDTIELFAEADPVSSRESAEQMVAGYLAGADPRDVRASPLFGDLKGLPPLLVQVGTSDILLADAVRVAERARGAGVSVDLQVAYEMVHVYQLFAHELPEAQEAIEAIGRFVQSCVAK